METPPTTIPGFSVPKFIIPSRTPFKSKSPDEEVLTDCWRASSFVSAPETPALNNEDKSSKLPCKLLDEQNPCGTGKFVLKLARFGNLKEEKYGFEEIFLGSLFLSERTAKGLKLAALRASMATF